MRLKNMPLKHKILMTNLVVLALATAVFTIVSTQMFQSYFIEETKRSLEREQQLVTQSLDTIFNSTQDYLRIVAADPRLQESIRDLRATKGTEQYFLHKAKITSTMADVLSNFIYPVSHVVGAAIFVDGQVIYSGYDIAASNVLATLPDGFLQQLQDTPRPVWADFASLQLDARGAKTVIPAGKSILHKQTGAYLGECIFFVEEATLATSFTAESNLNGNIYITGADDIVVSCADKALLGQNLTTVLGESYQKSIATSAANLAFAGFARDKNVYASASYPRMNWKIVNTASYEIAAQKSNRANVLFFAIGISCMLLLFASSNLIAYTIIKPINSIATSMHKAGQGDLQVRATQDYSGEVQIIATCFNALMDKVQQLLNETYQHQKQRRENEFKVLQAQINPHFLYNTIETIISFITLDMKQEATTTAMSLAGFYKLSLSSGKSMIPIGEELHLAQNYINIQKLRYEDILSCEIAGHDIDCYYIPKLTLQPLIENAIYHGIKEAERPGKITVTGCVEADTVVLRVHDTGAGIPPALLSGLLAVPPPQKSGSFGLANVHQRIQYRYGAQYGLQIESEPGRYTCVTVRLPKDTGGTNGGVV